MSTVRPSPARRAARRVVVNGISLLACAIALLLAPTTVGASAPTPNTSVAATLHPSQRLMPVGQAPVIALQPTHQALPPQPVSIPSRAMHPAALASAKLQAAAAISKSASAPARSAAPRAPSVALFNGLNQPGLSAADEGFGVTPPDTTGAIGPNFYVEFVNQMVGVFNRSNLSRVSSLDLGSFAGAPSGITTSDVQIQWDPQANRWLYALIGFQTSNNYVLFGWSKTADPSNLSVGWCRYGVFTGSSLNDYPKLGHDANFLTVGSNVYSDTSPSFPFVTANIWAIPKPLASDSTCSSAVSATYFADATHLLKNADGSPAFTPVPANTTDGAATGYIVAAHDDTLPPPAPPPTKVMVWHVALGPTLVADGDIPVGTFTVPPSVPQPGTNYMLDSLDGRLTQAVAHSDPSAGGAEAVWTQHTVAGAGGRAAVRWYEFLPATLAVRQEGELNSPTDHLFNAAISPSSVGSDAAVFFNRGSSTNLAVIGAQTRQSTTPAGQMDPGEVILGTSATFDQETLFSGNCTTNPCRWGDYSGASPDPSNAGVVWGSNQLIGLGFLGLGFAQWTTQNFAITTGAVAAADFSLSVTPTSQTVVAGNATSYTVTITPSGGFAGSVDLTVSGLPSAASGAFTPNPATSSSSLAVGTSSTTPAGTYPLTIQGVSGSLTHTASATLTVNPAPAADFSLSASPASRTVGGSVTSTTYAVTITPVNGFTGSVSLSVSGLLIGASGSFSPNPATSSSVLTVTITSTTPAGSYALTISGASGGLNHSTTVTLVVNSDFSLGAAPTSRTISRGQSTTYTVAINPLNGFSGSVTLSVSGLPNRTTASFNPNPATRSSVLTLRTSSRTTRGTYTLTITGTSAGTTHTVTAKLVVT